MGRTSERGRGAWRALWMVALVWAFAAAPSARADFDCGTALVRCQAEVANDGRVWFGSVERLTEDAPGDGTLKGGVFEIYERVGGQTLLISRSPDGTPLQPDGKLTQPAWLRGVSADGNRVYLGTTASLTPDDQDGGHEWASSDGYVLENGAYTLVTTGPGDSGQQDFGGNGAEILWASNDGSYVYFLTSRQLLPQDWDAESDIYQRHDGQTRLVSTGPDEYLPTPEYPNPFGGQPRFLGASPDGSTAYFASPQHLTADEPGKSPGEGWRHASDIFTWHDGVTTRLTHSVSSQEVPGTPDESFDPYSFAGAGEDGSVFFVARSGQVPEDTDQNPDVYRGKADGTLERVYASGLDGYGTMLAVQAVSRDGSRLFLFTNRQLLPVDQDQENDIYMWSGGRYTLISPDGETNGLDEELALCSISGSGRRAYFQTWASLVPEDTDEEPDVYEWSEGTVRLVSPSGEGRPSASFCSGISPNGRFVAFSTWEELIPGDSDTKQDIYVIDMGAGDASASGVAARPKKSRRRLRRLRLVTAESIAPRMGVAAVARLRDGSARLRLRCPKSERSGPCHGRVKLLAPKSHRVLASGAFRIPTGRAAVVRVSGPKLPRRPQRLLARVRAADMLGNRRTLTATVRLRRAR